MVNPQYIEYLNMFGADIDVDPPPLEEVEPLEKREIVKPKEHTAKETSSITTIGIDDLPFKIKIDESERKETEKSEKVQKVINENCSNII